MPRVSIKFKRINANVNLVLWVNIVKQKYHSAQKNLILAKMMQRALIMERITLVNVLLVSKEKTALLILMIVKITCAK